MENNKIQVAGADPAGASGGAWQQNPPVGRVVALDPVARREVAIVSEPMGDLFHSWATLFARNDEPSVQDVVRIARGEWLYRVLRFSISLSNPPADMHLSVHSHHMLSSVKRFYLYPSDFMPKLREGMFKGSFDATLENYYYQLATALLPGDKLFMHLYSRRPFRGELRILYW
jgi:hypothetical protein